MLQQAARVFIGFSLVFLLGVQSVWAVSFGRIDVASHLGEPFYAEVPLRLSESENIINVSVDLGSSSDYRILEVYRDQAINVIRTDILDDERGPRVSLSSEVAIDKAFFNLVVKVRYGRSTHYKKIPIFLESATIETMAASEQKGVPAVNSSSVAPETSGAYIAKQDPAAKTAFEEPVEEESAAQTSEQPVPVFKSFENWARTSRYGPMVYGDTISTVANRLRVDERFTNQQVMVALYEKNKQEFGNDNINLIKAGTYLDVPTESEVASISDEQAKRFLSEQNKAWKQLIKDPKYAAVDQAQKTRYSRRVRVGQNATGVSTAPVAMPDAQEVRAPEAVVANDDTAAIAAKSAEATKAAEAKLNQAEEKIAEKEYELQQLKNTVKSLEERLAASEKAAAAVPVQQDTGYTAASPDTAALEAQNKKLEIVISRLKGQLEQAKAQASTPVESDDMMMYGMAGLGALVCALLAAVVLLLRRKPKHPADQHLEDTGRFEAESFNEDSVATRVMDSSEFETADFEAPDDSGSAASASADSMFDEAPLEPIPDFTDVETGELESFKEEEEEEPDPNVNYIEEADVYLRYGMEDEAEKQIRMALKLNAQDPHAYAKLVQIQRVKGDKAGESSAVTTASAALAGAALATFEGLIQGEEASADEFDFGDSSPASTDADMGLSDLDPQFTGEDTGIMDFGDINLSGKQPAAGAMDDEELDTGSMDFGDLDFHPEPADAMVDEKIDTGELDFGNLDIEAPKIEAMEEPGVDSGEHDFGSLTESAPKETASIEDSSDGLDFDFSSMAEDFGNEAEAEASPSFEDTGDAEPDDSLDFNFSNMDESGEIGVEELSNFSADDLDSTTAISFDDETIVVNPKTAPVESLEGLNDREIDLAKAAAEEEAKAASVELDMSADDPFSAASLSLGEAEADNLSMDWSDDSLPDLSDDGMLSLDDKSASEDTDIELIEKAGSTDSDGLDFGSDDLDMGDFGSDDLSMGSEPAASTDDLGLDDLGDFSSDDLLSDIDSSDDAAPASDDLDFGGLDSDSSDDFGLGDLGSDDLSADSTPASSTDDFGLDDLGIDDLNFDAPDSSPTATATDDYGLDDLDFGDFGSDSTSSSLSSDLSDDFDSTMILNKANEDMQDLIGGISTSESATQSLSSNMSDDFDSTMILNRAVEDMDGIINEPKFTSIDDALSDESIAANHSRNPMDDDFSATEELGKLSSAFGSGSKSSELEDMLGDLDDLLDGDDLK